MIYRELKPAEAELLKDFTYEAIFIPEGAEPPPREILLLPELRLYYENFGSGPADICIAAEDGGSIVGAAWGRLMNDYGHIDEETPSLAISLLSEYRGRGIGTALLRELIARLRAKGFTKVSLSVQKANFAVKLYEKLGFRKIAENDEEFIMILVLRGDNVNGN